MKSELWVEAGTLLAAWPDLRDPNFMHSVVLVCHHTEEGAYGLVTNRRSPFTIGELLADHPSGAFSQPEMLQNDFPVYVGGPVDHNTLQWVHTVPDEIEGGFSIDGRLWLGGDPDQLVRFVTEERDRALTSVRVFLGYSGWGVGQLEGELEFGSWVPAPLMMDAVFGDVGEATWRRVVRSVESSTDLGGDLHSQPPDISWN